jgi:serine protease Do
MLRRIVFFAVLLFLTMEAAFAQTSLLRDYVGLINQTFHPDIVAYLEKFKADFEKQGNSEAVKGIDAYLKGGSGSGFVYVAPGANGIDGGANYIITNHHVITQSYTLSVTFEKQDGTKTKYDGLSILAADEDMDIAILAFPDGQRPFTSALAFLDRSVDEGEDVFSAGFPGLGSTTLWQFGRGMVSNAQVRFPAEDDTDRIMGPYIQHTAQVDPGNSGGPLLVQMPGVPAGYAVAGINTLKALYRQAANFSIPMDRVKVFLDDALGAEPRDEKSRLDARVASFIAGLDSDRPAYGHIARYISNSCTAENAEYALTEAFRSAPRRIAEDISDSFNYSPVEGMNYAVAWTIENSLRSPQGKIDIAVDTITVTGSDRDRYTINFRVNGGIISSMWIREYGIWRIGSFGDFAAGNKAFAEKAELLRKEEDKLRTNYFFTAAAGFTHILDRGHGFTADLKLRFGPTGYGIRIYTTGTSFFQGELTSGLYFPIRLKYIALTPYGDFGIGFMHKTYRNDSYLDDGPKSGDFGVSFHGGLQFTSSLLPGVFIQGGYQYNLYLANFADDSTRKDPHVFSVSVGYGF